MNMVTIFTVVVVQSIYCNTKLSAVKRGGGSPSLCCCCCRPLYITQSMVNAELAGVVVVVRSAEVQL